MTFILCNEFGSRFLFRCRPTGTLSGTAPTLAPSPLMSASVISPMKSWRLDRLLSVSKLVQTRVPHRPVRTWALAARYSSASEHLASPHSKVILILSYLFIQKCAYGRYVTTASFSCTSSHVWCVRLWVLLFVKKTF